MVQDKTWFRVRLGPYARIEEVNKVRSELAKQGIEAALVKKD
ncbi:MAG: SPOR domain-containing protein, partial [Rhodocyclaceae bacterium]